MIFFIFSIFAACSDCAAIACRFEGNDSDLPGYMNNISKLCTVECEDKLLTALECLSNQNCNVDTDRFYWNARCANVDGTNCINNRLDYWMKKGYTNLNTVITDNKGGENPGIPCTECEKKLFSVEKQDASTWTRNISDILNQSCGTNFMDNYSYDKNELATVKGNQATESATSSNTGMIIGIVIGLLVLIILVLGLVLCKRKAKRAKSYANPPFDEGYAYRGNANPFESNDIFDSGPRMMPKASDYSVGQSVIPPNRKSTQKQVTNPDYHSSLYEAQ